MQLDLDNLPTDTALLRRLVRDIAGGLAHRDTAIKQFRRRARRIYDRGMQFVAIDLR